MTITSSADAPLFVVVGATGTQGRSIIDAISADSKEYRVRGITRDPSKSNAQDLAKLGVEVVPGDVDDATSIEKAFQGAEVAFAMTVTDYWSPDGEEKVCGALNISLQERLLVRRYKCSCIVANT